MAKAAAVVHLTRIVVSTSAKQATQMTDAHAEKILNYTLKIATEEELARLCYALLA